MVRQGHDVVHAVAKDGHAHTGAVWTQVKEMQQLCEEVQLVLELWAPDATAAVQEEVHVSRLASATCQPTRSMWLMAKNSLGPWSSNK